MPRVVGRDAELAAIDQFVADAGDSPWSVLITGEAGIGKTALWRAVAAGLGSRSLVLATRSTEAESAFAFAALTDLLAPIPSSVFDGLPAPQREALEVATLRAAPSSEDNVDTRSIATAVSRLLPMLAAERPLIIALDDIQWLDPSSREVLEFAARRLSGPVGLLLAMRSPGRPLDAATDAALTVEVGPLTVAALHHLLRDEFESPLPRPVLVRVFETSGGNPLFALELARRDAADGNAPRAGPAVARARHVAGPDRRPAGRVEQ